MKIHVDLTSPREDCLVYGRLSTIGLDNLKEISSGGSNSVYLYDYDEDLRIEGIIDHIDEDLDLVCFRVDENTFCLIVE